MNVTRVQNPQRRKQGLDLDQGASAPYEAGSGNLHHPSATLKRHPTAGSAHPALVEQARWAEPADADADHLGPAPLGGGPGPAPGSQLRVTNRPEPLCGGVTLCESGHHPLAVVHNLALVRALPDPRWRLAFQLMAPLDCTPRSFSTCRYTMGACGAPMQR